ncbi:MAG: hypothetical protein JWQ27_2506 [Ferruginibacter sp.]|nr:hypothetical protein [Ferruginibacter sp.]
MQQEDLKEYVNSLPLLEPAAEFPGAKGANGDLASEGVEQSFLNAKSLVSFVTDVQGQRRNDVLNSVLFAQLAANKQFPNDEQIMDWYKAFIHVLNTLGWVIEAAEFSTFKASKDIFEVENAIIDILTTAFGGSFMTVIAKTMSSIKDLSDGNGSITAFEKNTHSLSKGAFQIGVAMEENDTVSLQLGTFLLTSSNEIKKILFFKSSKDKTRLDYCSRKGTLNEDVYGSIRETVKARLGEKTSQFIAEVEI